MLFLNSQIFFFFFSFFKKKSFQTKKNMHFQLSSISLISNEICELNFILKHVFQLLYSLAYFQIVSLSQNPCCFSLFAPNLTHEKIWKEFYTLVTTCECKNKTLEGVNL